MCAFVLSVVSSVQAPSSELHLLEKESLLEKEMNLVHLRHFQVMLRTS